MRRWAGSPAPAWRPAAPGSQGRQRFRTEQCCLCAGFYTLDCIHGSGRSPRRRTIPASRSRKGPGFCIPNRLTGVADAAGPLTITVKAHGPRKRRASWRLWRQKRWCFPQNLAQWCAKLHLVSTSHRPAGKGGSVHRGREPRREMQGRSRAFRGPPRWWQQRPPKGQPQRGQLGRRGFPHLERACVSV